MVMNEKVISSSKTPVRIQQNHLFIIIKHQNFLRISLVEQMSITLRTFLS